MTVSPSSGVPCVSGQDQIQCSYLYGWLQHLWRVLAPQRLPKSSCVGYTPMTSVDKGDIVSCAAANRCLCTVEEGVVPWTVSVSLKIFNDGHRGSRTYADGAYWKLGSLRSMAARRVHALEPRQPWRILPVQSLCPACVSTLESRWDEDEWTSPRYKSRVCGSEAGTMISAIDFDQNRQLDAMRRGGAKY